MVDGPNLLNRAPYGVRRFRSPPSATARRAGSVFAVALRGGVRDAGLGMVAPGHETRVGAIRASEERVRMRACERSVKSGACARTTLTGGSVSNRRGRGTRLHQRPAARPCGRSRAPAPTPLPGAPGGMPVIAPMPAARPARIPRSARAPTRRVAAGTTVDHLTETYRAHYRSLLGLAALLLDDTASCEDVVQEAFIRVHSARKRVRDPEKTLAYLRQTVVNLSRSALRRRILGLKLLSKPMPDMASAEEGAYDQLERDSLIKAMKGLQRRQREVLVLRYFADMTEAQVAETLGHIARLGQGVRLARHRGAARRHGGAGMSGHERKEHDGGDARTSGTSRTRGASRMERPWTARTRQQEPKQSHAGNGTVNHGPDDQEPRRARLGRAGTAPDAAPAPSRRSSPRDGTLDHLRRAVPARRARKRQAARRHGRRGALHRHRRPRLRARLELRRLRRQPVHRRPRLSRRRAAAGRGQGARTAAPSTAGGSAGNDRGPGPGQHRQDDRQGPGHRRRGRRTRRHRDPAASAAADDARLHRGPARRRLRRSVGDARRRRHGVRHLPRRQRLRQPLHGRAAAAR